MRQPSQPKLSTKCGNRQQPEISKQGLELQPRIAAKGGTALERGSPARAIPPDGGCPKHSDVTMIEKV